MEYTLKAGQIKSMTDWYNSILQCVAVNGDDRTPEFSGESGKTLIFHDRNAGELKKQKKLATFN